MAGYSRPNRNQFSGRSRTIYALALVGFVVLGVACGDEAATLTATERGGSIYARHCQTCHGDATTGEGAVAGAPTHGPDGHSWHHADGQLADIILGRFTFPGKTMPSFEGVLKEEEVADVLAFLKNGWEPQQVEFQAEVSRNWVEIR